MANRKKQELTTDIQEILVQLYDNNAALMKSIVNGVLKKDFAWINDYDHFYSLANEVIVKAINSYKPDMHVPFIAFFRNCYIKKAKSEISRINRKKRMTDKLSVSYHSPMKQGEEGTYEELLPDKRNIEQEILDNIACREYLSQLSKRQRIVVKKILCGDSNEKIQQDLNLSNAEMKLIREKITRIELRNILVG